MTGFVLDRPSLKFANSTIGRPDEKGSLRIKNKLKNPQAIKDWMFVYSIGKYKNSDDEDADKAVSLLQKAGSTYGIEVG